MEDVRRIRNGSVEPSPADAFDKVVETVRVIGAQRCARISGLETFANGIETEFVATETLNSCNHHRTKTEKVKNRKFHETGSLDRPRSSAVVGQADEDDCTIERSSSLGRARRRCCPSGIVDT